MAIDDESQEGSRNKRQVEPSNIGGILALDHNLPLYLSSFNIFGGLSVGIQLTEMENYTLWS